jgi:hypothetical protein
VVVPECGDHSEPAVDGDQSSEITDVSHRRPPAGRPAGPDGRRIPAPGVPRCLIRRWRATRALVRGWARGEVKMTQARAAGGHAIGAARDLRGAPRPHLLLARPRSSHTSPRTSSARPPMRSRPRVLQRRKAKARPQGDVSANGSVTNCQRRSANSCLTISGYATTSAGRCSTAERASVPGKAARNLNKLA